MDFDSLTPVMAQLLAKAERSQQTRLERIVLALLISRRTLGATELHEAAPARAAELWAQGAMQLAIALDKQFPNERPFELATLAFTDLLAEISLRLEVAGHSATSLAHFESGMCDACHFLAQLRLMLRTPPP